MLRVSYNVVIHCRNVVIQNEKARGYNGVLVSKWIEMVVKRVLIVQQSNDEVDKSCKIVPQRAFEALQHTIVVCFCSNVSLHCGNVVIQNRKARGHSFRIYKLLPMNYSYITFLSLYFL